MPFHTGPYAFLTTKPIKRRLSMDHPEWLYILPTQAISSANLTYKLTYTDDATTTKTIALGNLLVGKKIQVQIGNDILDYEQWNPTKTIRFIEFYISDPGYDKLTYYPYSPVGDDVRAIYYHNTFGGVDTLILEGSQQDSYDFNSEQTQKPLNISWTLHNDPQRKTLNQRGNITRQVHTGPKPAGELVALRDLFMFKRAYEYRVLQTNHPFMVPIIPNENSITFPSTRENINKLSFSYQYATEQRAYDRVI